ncbi:cold shock domain-containing protein [Mesorhizobium sp. M4B.F.Ca.ET.013.02.1.1]|nr:cold shock domain-containing protein [Mesorhizobium sp. M4B.F.Ca.ET.013.02.1.1]
MNWKEERGFGFIRPDAGDRDLFAHVTNLVGVDELKVGTKVSFDDGINERSGKPEARNIRLMA